LTPVVCCSSCQSITEYLDGIRKVGKELPLLSVVQSSDVMIGIVTHKEGIIIIISIIIIFIFSSFMQGIYTYIPEKNHVPREYIVAAILSLLFMVPIPPVPALALLYFYVSTFRVCVQCPIWLFSVVP
jgi:hypothetical protein